MSLCVFEYESARIHFACEIRNSIAAVQKLCIVFVKWNRINTNLL